MVVPVDDNEILYLQLRNKFFENLKANGNYDDYEDIDLERLRNDDHYCKRFILHKKGNFENALLMVDEALKWRKSFGVKNVTQESIPIEFFQAKAVFPYNKDKEDNPIIMILVRYHKRASEFAEALRKFVIYWVELMEEQTNGGQMTVIMSCSGAGISNLDLDLIKFLITLFRSYYPHSLAHILIYEMPWILNPAWKIIKAWLPEDFVDKIKFVNKTSILDYVSEDNLPVDMGGTDTTEYEPPSVISDVNSNNVPASEPKRIANGYLGKKYVRGNSSQILITDDYTIAGGILKICPASELCFSLAQPSKDVLIKLSCVSEKPISYKVKTNNIESYRVKPSSGTIEPGSTVEITVVLLQDFHPLPTDKFLIMAMEVSDPKMSMSELNALWKNAKTDVIADHKLKCVAREEKAQKPENEEIDIARSLQNINSLLSNIDAKVQSIHAKQSTLQLQLILSLLLTGFLFLVVFTQIFLSEDSFIKSTLGFN